MYKSEIVRCNNHVVLLCQNQVLKQEHQNKDSIGSIRDTYNLLYVISNNVWIRPTFTNFNGQIGIDRKNWNIIPVLEKFGGIWKKMAKFQGKIR